MDLTGTTTEDVKAVLVSVLGIEDRAASIDADTQLLGNLPELVTIDDDEVTAEAFDTLGSLTAMVAGKAG
jgi:acyl carrier protein